MEIEQNELNKLVEKLKKLAVKEINESIEAKTLTGCIICEGAAIISSLRMINRTNSYQICCSKCLIHALIGDSVKNAVDMWEFLKKLILKKKNCCINAG